MAADPKTAVNGKPKFNPAQPWRVEDSLDLYNVNAWGLNGDPLTAVTLQRRRDGGPGPVVAVLVEAGLARDKGRLILPAKDRSDLFAGNFYIQLYTRSAPLGVGRAILSPQPK